MGLVISLQNVWGVFCHCKGGKGVGGWEKELWNLSVVFFHFSMDGFPEPVWIEPDSESSLAMFGKGILRLCLLLG